MSRIIKRFSTIFLSFVILVTSITFSPITAHAMDDATFDSLTQSFLADERWANGAAWGYRKSPELSSYRSMGCCAYAVDFVKYVYGYESVRSGTQYTDISEIRKGDVVYMKPDHWIVVLDRDGDNLYTAEGNIYSKTRVRTSSAGWVIDGTRLKMHESGTKTSENRAFSYGYHYDLASASGQGAATVSTATSSGTQASKPAKAEPPVPDDILRLDDAEMFTETTVRINSHFDYAVTCSEVGFYLGTSIDGMTKKRTSRQTRKRDSIYFDLGDGELIDALTPATEYFYCFYAVINGKEYRSENGVFLTVGVPDEPYFGWIRDNGGLWYKRENGTSPVSCFENIGGDKYYFGEDGYLQTGWIENNGKEYFINSDGRPVKNAVVDSYALGYDGARMTAESPGAANMQTVKIKNGKTSATISVMGAELKSLTKGDTEYMWSGDPEFWGRTSPVLFPFVGAVNNKEYTYNGETYSMNQHGFARDLVFELVEKKNSSCKFVLKSNEKTKEMYPFDFELYIIYTIKNGELRVDWEVKNPSEEENLEFSIGAHPAFNCNLKESSLVLKKEGKVVSKVSNSVFGSGLLTDKKADIALDGGALAMNEHTFDGDALVIEDNQADSVEILDKDGKCYLSVEFDAPLFGLWSPPGKNAPFVCIEPWYGRADKEGFSGELKDREWNNTLAAKESFKAGYTIKVY